MRNICIIPARMGSTRYPGKPLEPLLTLPLILHVWHRCRLDTSLDRVLIATCDKKIQMAAKEAGADVVMTSDTHERATDRTEEAVKNMDLDLADDDFVLMVQGDEVLVNPDVISLIVVVFPDPFGPRNPTTSPFFTLNDTLFTAIFGPNCFVTPST